MSFRGQWQGGAAAVSGYRTANAGHTRDLNRAAIFRLIVSAGPIARASIANSLQRLPSVLQGLL